MLFGATPVWGVPCFRSKNPTPVTVAVPFRSAKSLDGPGTEPHALVRSERAFAICDFLGELDAPLQLVSGNSTIIVLDGELGTPITRWMSRSSSRLNSISRALTW